MRKQVIGLMQDILPEYNKVKEGGHGKDHIIDVIEKSYDMAIEFNENPEVCCVAALLHDIGLITHSREEHHIGSEIWVKEHKEMLKRFFKDNEIYRIQKAVLEHRSTFKGKYTSFISRIISDADRSTNIYLMISRSYLYNKSKGYDEEEIYKNVYTHLKEKYGEREYVFMSNKLQKELDEAKEILLDENKFNEYYKKIVSEL